MAWVNDTTEIFIQKAILKHSDKYSYVNVKYVGSQTKVDIICKLHGRFSQTPAAHLNGQGCPTCSGRKQSTNIFIEKARKVHGTKYNYNKVVYKKQLNSMENIGIMIKVNLFQVSMD